MYLTILKNELDTLPESDAHRMRRSLIEVLEVLTGRPIYSPDWQNSQYFLRELISLSIMNKIP